MWRRVVLMMILVVTTVEAVGWQGGITVFGRVYQPDGQPAVRAKVKIEIVNGFTREVWSDDQGSYEFRAVPAGRYRLAASNPEVREQFSEPAESDSTRSFANRLQVNLYLRLPVRVGPEASPPGTISVEEAAQRVPGGARKAYEQALKSRKGNDDQKALEQLNRAIELYPDYFQALTERGNIRMARNQLAEAAGDFERVLSLSPRNTAALRGLGYCQIQQRQFEAAIGNLERAYAQAPDVALTLLLLGYGNMALNRIEPARQCLNESIRLDESAAARAHVYLGEILAGEGRFRAAAEEIDRYLRLKPEATDAAELKKRRTEWRERAGK